MSLMYPSLLSTVFMHKYIAVPKVYFTAARRGFIANPWSLLCCFNAYLELNHDSAVEPEATSIYAWSTITD